MSIINVYMRLTGDVVDDTNGTLQQHYRYAFKHNGMWRIAGELGPNHVVVQTRIRHYLKGFVVHFVGYLREAS